MYNIIKKKKDPKLRKLWEVITFKDFLMNRSTVDEIYFFLFCRFLLFKGS